MPPSASAATTGQVELFADLYELRMVRAYRALEMEAEAVFSRFVQRLPPARNFLLACGGEDLQSTLFLAEEPLLEVAAPIA
jgi:nicotinic acid phosphoribosyltransferase